MNTYATLDELHALVGKPLGTSEWVVVTQSMIDRFAEVTMDAQWIHVDPARAAAGPFGAPIAHGFLTLSLLSALSVTAFRVSETRMGVNAGLDRVRFTSPVLVGQRVRGHFALHRLDLGTNLGAEGARMLLDVTIEIDGSEKPALVAQWLVRQYR